MTLVVFKRSEPQGCAIQIKRFERAYYGNLVPQGRGKKASPPSGAFMKGSPFFDEAAPFFFLTAGPFFLRASAHPPPLLPQHSAARLRAQSPRTPDLKRTSLSASLNKKQGPYYFYGVSACQAGWTYSPRTRPFQNSPLLNPPLNAKKSAQAFTPRRSPTHLPRLLLYSLTLS